MPFEDGKPTSAEVAAKESLDRYNALERARPIGVKISEEADQIAMREPWWVWLLAGCGVLALLAMIAAIVLSCGGSR